MSERKIFLTRKVSTIYQIFLITMAKKIKLKLQTRIYKCYVKKMCFVVLYIKNSLKFKRFLNQTLEKICSNLRKNIKFIQKCLSSNLINFL